MQCCLPHPVRRWCSRILGDFIMAYFDPSAEWAFRNVGQAFQSAEQHANRGCQRHSRRFRQPPPKHWTIPATSLPIALPIQGVPLRQARLHRDLQRFLSEHRKALIELPRNSGKSVQICASHLGTGPQSEPAHQDGLARPKGIAAERAISQRSH